MAEYIDRDGLINDLKDLPEQERIEYMGIYDCIKSTTAADVTEVRHGKWIESEDDYYGLYIIKCSLCREVWCFEVEDAVKLMNYNYCPNCGAEMDGEVGNDNGSMESVRR